MAVLTSALDTTFTPTKTSFTVSIQSGAVSLEARGSATAPWGHVGDIQRFAVVDNPVSGTQYRLINRFGTGAIEVNE